MTLPSLTALRTFRAAAEELAVTQSAVSHQVADLEKSLGVALFKREARRVALTEAGLLYYPFLRDAFERIAQGTALFTRTSAAGELNAQVYITVAVRWLIPRLPGFQQAHADILVRFSASHIDWEFDETAAEHGII